MIRRPAAALAAIMSLSLCLVALVAVAPAAQAKRGGTPVIVSVGDSFISGEAGRWAGNSNDSSSRVDALGPTAYFDNANQTAETIAKCHRSRTAEVHIGGGINSVNLACSGATAATAWADGAFKPGIDFYDDGLGHQGQAAMLRDIAKTQDVKLIVLSIGGNDFHFADIIQQCVTDYVLSTTFFPDYCNDDSSVTQRITPQAQQTVQTAIVTSLHNLRQAMRDAGYADGSYDVVIQNYPLPVPAGALFRYPEAGFSRVSTGGCGLWNADADWAAGTLISIVNNTVKAAAKAAKMTKLHQLDNSAAFAGHGLCDNRVGLLEETNTPTWQSTNAVDTSEWVAQVRTLSTVFGPYQVQESLHPNYWGQQALQACLRLAWNKGKVKGGACTIAGTGLVNGDPRMKLK